MTPKEAKPSNSTPKNVVTVAKPVPKPAETITSAGAGQSSGMGLGILLTMGMMVFAGGTFVYTQNAASTTRTEALTSATAEIGEAFGAWSVTNPESAQNIERKELSYDQFTQKIQDNTERDNSIVKRSSIMYVPFDDGNYEICVISEGIGMDNPSNYHIYSSETEMVAVAKQCS